MTTTPERRTPRTWFPRFVDPVVVAFLRRPVNAVLLVATVATYSVAWPTLALTHHLPAALLPVFAAFASWPLLIAHVRPQTAWCVSALGAFVTGVVPRVNDWEWRVQVVHIVTLVALTFAVYLWGPVRRVPLYSLGTVLLILWIAPADQRAGWIVGAVISAVVIGLLRGLATSRRRLERETELRDVADARAVALAERTRIARDLHDVVAHRMSVVVVAAQTARYRVDDVGPAADAEFQQIAQTAREALDEVRALLGVLRIDDVGSSTGPVRGLADIVGLVETTRAGGVDVEFVGVDGDTVTAPACGADEPQTAVLDVDSGSTPGLVAYRIVQEGLANAVRHAPGAPIALRVNASAHEVHVVIRNTLVGNASDRTHEDHAGHGIPGMRERTHAVGGQITIGPDDAGDFVVDARLPRSFEPSIESGDVHAPATRHVATR